MSRGKNVKSWRQRMKVVLVHAMGGKCQICSYDRCISALEFHHLDGTKDFSISGMLSNIRRSSLIFEEAKKCILVCSNCHKELHAGLVLAPENFFRFDGEKAESKKLELLKSRKERVSSENLVKSGAKNIRSTAALSAKIQKPQVISKKMDV